MALSAQQSLSHCTSRNSLPRAHQRRPPAPLMLRHAQQALLPRLLGSFSLTGSSSRGWLQQASSIAGSGSNVSSGGSSGNSSGRGGASPPVTELQGMLDILQKSIAWERAQHYVDAQGATESFSQYASNALRVMQGHMAAAVKQGSSSSSGSSGGGGISRSGFSSVAPSLLKYADLLGSYGSFSVSQRRQMLEALQQQLLPQVSALAGLPVFTPAQPAPLGTNNPSRPAIAASGLLDHQQQQLQQQEHQQEQPPLPGQRKRAGPPKLPGPPRVRRTQSQAAVQPLEQMPPPPQQQQQRQGQLELHSTAEVQQVSQGSAAPPQQAVPEVVQQQQQQHGQQVSKRSAGPPRRPGPAAARRPTSLAAGSSTAVPAAADAAAVGQQAQHSPAPEQIVQQQQQPEDQPEQQQQQQRPVSPGPKRIGPPMRTRSAPSGALAPPPVPTPAPPHAAAAPTQPDAGLEGQPGAPHQQQQPQQQSPQQQRRGPPRPASTSSGSSSRPAASAGGPSDPHKALKRAVGANGPYPPRRHTPYPPAASKAELQQLHEQQRKHLQGPVPAWQLYWPLPEKLGGPARSTAVTAAAAVDASTGGASDAVQEQQQGQEVAQHQGEAALLPGESGTDAAEGAEDASSRSGRGRKGRGVTRDKGLSDAKWEALLVSARQYQERMQQEQQRQQQEATGQLKQRTGAWLRLRESRLTGSVLTNMLSWFDGQDRADHVRLWREKLGLQKPPPPNKKMVYGACHEHLALSSYQHLAPHEALQDMGFAVWGADDAHDWLAASPDGLITLAGAGEGPAAGAGGVSEEVAAWVQQQTGSSFDGVLEIKCPYKASANVGAPRLPGKMDPYYMPQVQVLCEVLEREWAVVYYWSPTKGSHMTLVHRDRDYFNLLWRAMADFWWRHLVPAKMLLEADPTATDRVEQTYSPRIHPYRAEIIRRSKAMVAAAPQRTFSVKETMGPHQQDQLAAAAAVNGDAGDLAAAEAAAAEGSQAGALAAEGAGHGDGLQLGGADISAAEEAAMATAV